MGETQARRVRIDWVIVGLLAIACWLLFGHLDNGYLWQDEAETAVLARAVVTQGYPRAYDGRSYIEITSHGYGPGESWVYSPWLPFYLLAAVFAVAGQSTWTARLPFAACGLLSLYLTWRLAGRLLPDRRVQRLSVALLICSVPFLLHMRQCRYYALTTVLLLGICQTYLALLEHPRRSLAVWLSVLLVLLFHTNFGLWIPAVVAVVLHQGWWGRWQTRRWGWIGAIVVGLFTLPWAIFTYRPAFLGHVDPRRLFDHLEYYIRITNKFLLPIAAMGVSGLIVWCARRQVLMARLWQQIRPPARWFVILMISAQLVFLLIPDQRHMRYLIPTLPLLVFVEALWLVDLIQRSRLIGGMLTVLALFTTGLQSTHWHVPLVDLGYELTHAYTGPMEGIVAYLRAHANPGDRVKIPYDDRTVLFYTALTVERPSTFAEETYPEWIVLRRGWTPAAFFFGDYFRRIEATYDRIELDAPDVYWQNREDPGSHHFATVLNAPRVILYHQRPAAVSARMTP